jgi:hypothetical protein
MLYSPHLVITGNLLTSVFLGSGFGVMDQFRGLRAHPIVGRLIYSYRDTLRTFFPRPPMTSLDELKLRIVAAIERIRTLGGKLNKA